MRGKWGGGRGILLITCLKIFNYFNPRLKFVHLENVNSSWRWFSLLFSTSLLLVLVSWNVILKLKFPNRTRSWTATEVCSRPTICPSVCVMLEFMSFVEKPPLLRELIQQLGNKNRVHYQKEHSSWQLLPFICNSANRRRRRQLLRRRWGQEC